MFVQHQVQHEQLILIPRSLPNLFYALFAFYASKTPLPAFAINLYAASQTIEHMRMKRWTFPLAYLSNVHRRLTLAYVK